MVATDALKPNKDRLWVLDHDGGEHHLIDNGSEITTYGVRTKLIRLGSKRLTWNFVADVDLNILDADFLVHHNLVNVVDLRHRRLIDAKTLECIRVGRHDAAIDGTIGAHHASVANVNAHFSGILDKFPSITKPEVFSATSTHDVKHFIATSGPPIRTQVRRLSPERLAIAKKKFEDMETLGIIQ